MMLVHLIVLHKVRGSVMQGVQKFLQLLNDNWITILVCLGCVAGIVRKTVDFFSKSDDEK